MEIPQELSQKELDNEKGKSVIKARCKSPLLRGFGPPPPPSFPPASVPKRGGEKGTWDCVGMFVPYGVRRKSVMTVSYKTSGSNMDWMISRAAKSAV